MSDEQRQAEERDFLLASLDDLDAEFAAGDIDEADYRALRSDYTTRAAQLLRVTERGSGSSQTPANETGSNRLSAWRTAIWFLSVAAVVIVVGVGLLQFSGSRSQGDAITGDIRTTTRELLFEAQQQFGSGDLPGAIASYEQVLVMQPSNTEALAYLAWLLRLSGDSVTARPLVEDAVSIDGSYPDARVFATVLALDANDPRAAFVHLEALDLLPAAPFIEQLVAQQGLRERVADAAQAEARDRVSMVLNGDDPPRFSESGLTVTDVLLAAEALAADDQLFSGLELVQFALEDRPNDPDLLAGQGWLLGRSATEDSLAPAELALTYLDRALAEDPWHPEALVYRSFVRNFLGDVAGAQSDLAFFDQLPVRPADLRELVALFGLRSQLGTSDDDADELN